jgi:predicted PurR-regulated permease PerM
VIFIGAHGAPFVAFVFEDFAVPARAHRLGRSRVSLLTSIGVLVALLYFAQEVLVPLALSVMLAFLLAPLSTRLERWRLGRVSSVLAVVGIAFAIILSVGWVVGRQLVQLAEDLPRYQDEMVQKAHRFRSTGAGFGTKIQKLGKELERAAEEPATHPTSAPATQPSTTGVVGAAAREFGSEPMRGVAREAIGGPPTTAPAAAGTTPANPLYAVTLPAPVSPIKTMATYLGLVLGPLGTAALVVVFVVFMLLEREDLRDRMIQLISRGRYTVTTRALNDAATRISRYMLAQVIVNGSYGLTVAIGLWIIGLTAGHGVTFPSFVLWGLICAVLRFVPYIGPWVAIVFPVTLSLAVYPGFTVFALTVGMLVLVELVSNNVLEPWLYGTSTGLSTVALIVAAVFWTWLWGPIGLLLSTPLTVCIVVLGKHVPQLKFLDVLLSDKPALPPSVSYYQRLLAGDREEAEKVASGAGKSLGAEQLPDEVFIPALLHARRDRAEDDLTAEKETEVLDATGDIIARLFPGPRPVEETAGARPDTMPLVLGCPAHHRVEELVVRLLGATMAPNSYSVEALSTRLLPAEVETTIEHERPAVLFIAVMPPGGIVQARYLCRRLRKRFKELPIVVGYWGRVRNFDALLVKLRAAGASYVTTSLAQTKSQIEALVAPPASPPATSPPPQAAVALP